MAPERIVSLVPSLTELVFWLGRGERLVGRTKFCTEPAGKVEAVPAMGGTKNPDVARIVAARPGLVIANKEENRREDVEALQAAGVNVLLTDPNSVPEALALIRDLGRRLESSGPAERLAGEVEELLAAEPRHSTRVYAGVWHSPLMGLGDQTYGDSVLRVCGAVNVLAGRPRYPHVSWDELRALAPDLIFLPDEPFPFDEGHAALYREVAPVRIVDGKLLWWYGPRMPAALRALRAVVAGGGA